MKKEKFLTDMWVRDLAPSSILRRSFGHNAENFPGFRRDYLYELNHNPYAYQFMEQCREILQKNNITLLYSARDYYCCDAPVIAEWLTENLPMPTQALD